MSRSDRPKAANAIPTTSKLWAIQNYTKYKTQDIVDLFNLVEAQILKNRLLVNKDFKLQRTPIYKDKAKMEVPFFIDTYTPSEDKKTRGTTEKGIEYLKYRNRDRDCIRILDPTIGMSPTEQLSHAGDPDGIPVPPALLTELTLQVIYSYYGASERIYDAVNQWLAQPVLQAVMRLKPQLRFLQRSEYTKPTIESGDTRYCRLASEKSSTLKYSIQDAVFRLKKARDIAENLNVYAKKRKVDPYVDVRKLDTLLQEFEKFQDGVSAVSRTLFNEHDNNQKLKKKE